MKNKNIKNRGVSEVIGFILITGLVVTGVTVVLLLGAGDITNAQQGSEIQHAQNSLSEFDSEVSQVALNQDGNSKTSVNLGLLQGPEKQLEFSSDSQLSIMTIGIASGGGDFDDFDEYENVYNSLDDCSDVDIDEDCKADYQLGTLEYQNGDDTVGYEGGGVWRQAGGSQAFSVSPPEFHYRQSLNAQQTLTMPLITLSADDGELGSDRITVERANSSGDQIPERLSAQTAVVRVESEYALGWERYFNNEVGEKNVETVTQDGVTYIQFLALDDVIIDTESEDPLTTGEQSDDNYNAYMGNLSTDFNSEQDLGEIGTANELPEEELPDGVEKDGNKMTISEGGTYYADTIQLDGNDGTVDHIKMDATNGDENVEIIVDGDVFVINGGEIEGIGMYDSDNPDDSQTTQIYIPDGEYVMESGTPVVSGENIIGPEDDRIMQLYGTEDTLFTIGQSSQFNGIIYNPGAGEDNPDSNCSAPGQVNTAGICMNPGSGVDAQGLAITGTADGDAEDGFEEGDIGDEPIVLPTVGDDENKVFFIHISENSVELN